MREANFLRMQRRQRRRPLRRHPRLLVEVKPAMGTAVVLQVDDEKEDDHSNLRVVEVATLILDCWVDLQKRDEGQNRSRINC